MAACAIAAFNPEPCKARWIGWSASAATGMNAWMFWKNSWPTLNNRRNPRMLANDPSEETLVVRRLLSAPPRLRVSCLDRSGPGHQMELGSEIRNHLHRHRLPRWRD